MLLLYRVLSYLATPLVWFQLGSRCLRDPTYRARILERFGYVTSGQVKPLIWFHAVSVGEVIAIVPLVKYLCQQSTSVQLLVTTTTPSGSMEVKRRLGPSVLHFYAPYDLRRCVNRFLKRLNPLALFLVETELWPNLIDCTDRRRIPIYLINARLSARSAQRYARFRWLTRSMLQKVSGISCQYEDTAERFVALGANPTTVSTIGSIKFDIEIPIDLAEQTQSIRDLWCCGRKTWIAASTHASEEEIILEAHQKLLEQFPELFLIVVPRHPPRVSQVETLCRTHELSVRKLSESPQPVQVMLVDQMGVLLTVLGCGSLVFIGGSLEGTGGHNPIEPATLNVPMLMGPDRHNFEEICKRFEQAQALQTVRSADELVAKVTVLLQNPEQAKKQAAAAFETVQANRGAQSQLEQTVRHWIDAATDPINS